MPPSSSPTRAHPAPTLWDSPPASAARLAASSCATPVTTVPVESSGSVISPATQSSAQSCDAGGSRYSPPERIQRALRLAHLHEENRKWHEREAALLAWAVICRMIAPVPLAYFATPARFAQPAQAVLGLPVMTNPWLIPIWIPWFPAVSAIDIVARRRLLLILLTVPYLGLGTKISCRNLLERLRWLHGYSGLRLRVRENTFSSRLAWALSTTGATVLLTSRGPRATNWHAGSWSFARHCSKRPALPSLIIILARLRWLTWSAPVRIMCLFLILLCPALALTLCPRPAFRLVLLPGFSKTRLPVQDVHPGGSAILDLLFFQLA